MVGRADSSGDREVSKFIKPTIGIQWYRKVTGGTEREYSRKAAYNAGGREVRIRI